LNTWPCNVEKVGGGRTAMTISFVKQAQTAFEAGDYLRAVALYEQAMLQRPLSMRALPRRHSD